MPNFVRSSHLSMVFIIPPSVRKRTLGRTEGARGGGGAQVRYPGRVETFYLGTHQPHWLAKTDVPLFVSVRRLMTMNRLPRAKGPWAIDSAGFTELSRNGRWTISVDQYVAE